MKNNKKAEEIAVERMQLISPLVAEGVDPGKIKELKKAICEQTGLSERTLHRYLSVPILKHSGSINDTSYLATIPVRKCGKKVASTAHNFL